MNLIALDCSNSSVRASLGVYTDGKIHMVPVYQVPNDMVRVGGYDYWDILHIFHEAKNGLKAAIAAAEGPVDGIGVSTWGIDFALYDGDGYMLSNPLAYRNQLGAEVLDRLDDRQQAEMFCDTGILCDRINSVYMIAGMKEAMPGITGGAKKLLMVPDIMHYLLTGVMRTEPSEFSTTQLMDSRTMELSGPVLDRFDIPREWFSPFAEHGQSIGPLTAEVKGELGIDYDIPVICVASHDTASAVVAVPAEENPFVFISSGTWSLIGTEIDKPLVNEAVLKAGVHQ